jgi:hypothetical protein
MDPNQTWNVDKAKAMGRRDALDHWSTSSAERHYSSRKILATAVIGGGLLAGAALWYLADSSIGERDRLATAPEITLSRYLLHIRNGTQPLVNIGTNLVKPKYIQLVGFAEEIFQSETSTNALNRFSRTYQFRPFTNEINTNVPNNSDTNINLSNYSFSASTSNQADKVYFQAHTYIDTIGLYAKESIPSSKPIRLTVSTKIGSNTQIISNGFMLKPLVVQQAE